jgi:hypothetical protein
VTPCAVHTMHEETRSAGFWVEPQTKVDGLSVLWHQNHCVGFPGLGLKTNSYDMVIWASKSLRQFLGLGFKTKRAMICRLRHKINGMMKTVRGTRQDLAACFVWKQVGLGYPSLTSRLVEARRGCCTWHHHRGWVELKLKTDELM